MLFVPRWIVISSSLFELSVPDLLRPAAISIPNSITFRILSILEVSDIDVTTALVSRSLSHALPKYIIM